jgi:hypothetical protein
MDPSDDKEKPDTQALTTASLISGTAILIGVAVYFLGEDRVGIWFYPAIAVSLVVWLYGQARLISAAMALARAQRERRERDGE